MSYYGTRDSLSTASSRPSDVSPLYYCSLIPFDCRYSFLHCRLHSSIAPHHRTPPFQHSFWIPKHMLLVGRGPLTTRKHKFYD
ncbi:hypothetical protein HID58_081832 [Brassica napus]|uniref:Uncharacterized protein n=1 Tax=Brassica napus TaxID=3708 RepID=A0ABQ7Y8X0_BRANA|nr:hypothetical protein HID58_081832 [Brassica napus]